MEQWVDKDINHIVFDRDYFLPYLQAKFVLYRVSSPLSFESPARLHRTRCYLNSGSHFCVGQVCGLWLADPQPQPCLWIAAPRLSVYNRDAQNVYSNQADWWGDTSWLSKIFPAAIPHTQKRYLCLDMKRLACIYALHVQLIGYLYLQRNWQVGSRSNGNNRFVFYTAKWSHAVRV